MGNPTILDLEKLIRDSMKKAINSYEPRFSQSDIKDFDIIIEDGIREFTKQILHSEFVCIPPHC